MENKYMDYGIEELGEGEWDGNDSVGLFRYNDDIEFLIKFPGNFDGSQEEHLMIFKLLNNGDGNINVIGLCRISMLKPEYITGYNENYELTDDEVDFIYRNLLETEPDEIVSKWDYIVRDYVMYNYELHDKQVPCRSYFIPDYLLLKKGDK